MCFQTYSTYAIYKLCFYSTVFLLNKISRSVKNRPLGVPLPSFWYLSHFPISLDLSTDLCEMSHQISSLCSEWAAAFTRTSIYLEYIQWFSILFMISSKLCAFPIAMPNYVQISRPIPVQCRVRLVVYIQNEALHLFDSLFNFSAVDISHQRY